MVALLFSVSEEDIFQAIGKMGSEMEAYLTLLDLQKKIFEYLVYENFPCTIFPCLKMLCQY